jgi:hypothetical protein
MSFYGKVEEFRLNNNNEETLGNYKGKSPLMVATGHGDGRGTKYDL